MTWLTRWLERLMFWRKPKQMTLEFPKRICANCELPIKRNHKWSQKRWPDNRPRHWSCTNPSLGPADDACEVVSAKMPQEVEG